MSTDILDQLGAAAAPLLAARDEIAALRADIEAHQESLGMARNNAAQDLAAHDNELTELRQQLADLVSGASDRAPALPRPVKLWGTAATLDGVAAIYTETAMRRAIDHAYAQGRARGEAETRKKHGIPAPSYGPTREQWDRDAADRKRRRGG